MRKILLVLVFLVAIYQLAQNGSLPFGNPQHPAMVSRPGAVAEGGSNDDALTRALEERQSKVAVQGEGIVSKVLADDDEGSRHQRFIVRMPSGQTILVAHNIDIAPRVEGLNVGDRIGFSGEYEWNDRGGVVHWTHRDPSGRHVAGWLRHGDKLYQ